MSTTKLGPLSKARRGPTDFALRRVPWRRERQLESVPSAKCGADHHVRRYACRGEADRKTRSPRSAPMRMRRGLRWSSTTRTLTCRTTAKYNTAPTGNCGTATRDLLPYHDLDRRVTQGLTRSATTSSEQLPSLIEDPTSSSRREVVLRRILVGLSSP